MSLAVEVGSSSKGIMGLDKEDDSPEVSEPKKAEDGEDVDATSGLSRKMSESSICATEEEDDEDGRKIELGPQYTLKELNEKDKVSLTLPFLRTSSISFNSSCALFLG